MINFMKNENLSAQALNLTTPLEAALALATLGLKLLPICPPNHHGVHEKHAATCSNPGKAPRITNWPIRATNDPKTLTDWFLMWPESNLGMLTGSKTGIIAIDSDGGFGRARLNEIFKGNIPVTWQFTTPGGERYLFKVQPDHTLHKYTESSPNGGHEEFSILANGQQTVVPPSVHRSGGRYEWVLGRGPGDVPLADAPQEILDLLGPSRTAVSLFDDGVTEDDRFSGPSTPTGQAQNKTPAVDQTKTQFLTGNAELDELVRKCWKVNAYVSEQQDAGCDEDTWHKTTSMLVRSGHPDAARTFSKLSDKHDRRSEQRISDMVRDGTSSGPTRCTTFGCDIAQIERCFGTVRTNQSGEATNSPATFFAPKNTNSPEKAPTSATIVQEKAGMLPGRYELDDRHLCLVVPKGEGKVDYQPQANFFAWISKQVVKDDGAEKVRFYGLEGIVIATGTRLPPILVPSVEFETMKWLSQWGPEPNMFPGNKIRDTVRHAIQSTAHGMSVETIYAHLGWVRIDGSWVYLHSNGAIGADNVKVELDPRLKNYGLPESVADPKGAMQASLDLLSIAPLRVTSVLWALVYLSALCEWFRRANKEPNFVVWLHGYTGSRKTSLAQLFLCHFGDLLQRPPANFKDTANSLEKRGFDCKDSLLLIDDFHPASSSRQKDAMMGLASQILRAYGDRASRGRMRQDGTLRPDFPPRGLAIVTAEDVISVGSDAARLFPVELLRTDVDLKRLTEAQRNTPKLTEAMASYLQWIADDMNRGDFSRLRKMFEEKRDEAIGLNVHGRLVESAVWLYMGLQMGLDYATSVGAIEPDIKEKLLAESWGHFLNAADEQGNQVSEIRATTRFLSIVAELLASGAIHTNPVKSVYGTPEKSGIHVGWHDADYFYFLPKILFNQVSYFLKRQGDEFPVSDTTLWKQLGEEGFSAIETSKEKGKERKHYTRKKEIDGERSRKLWVRTAAFVGEVHPDPDAEMKAAKEKQRNEEKEADIVNDKEELEKRMFGEKGDPQTDYDAASHNVAKTAGPVKMKVVPRKASVSPKSSCGAPESGNEESDL